MSDFRAPREYLADSFDQFMTVLAAYLPRLLPALALILAGFLLANVVRWIVRRVSSGLDALVSHTSLGDHLRLRWPVSNIIAGAGYWIILVLFLTAAAEALGLPGFSDLLDSFIGHIPGILGGIAIVLAGVFLGGFAREAVIAAALRSRMAHGEAMGSLVRTLVLTLTVVIGLEQLGLDLRLLEHLLLVLTAAVVFSLALGFGLGAAPTVANIIAIRNVRRHYRVGQTVRVGDVEGVILELSTAFVVLDTDHGRTLVPAKAFEEQVSTLLESAGDGTG